VSSLDETDVRILELLSEDARRSYSDISDRVGLSAPAVSDRIERLRQSGVVRRFTVDVDRSQLRGGVPVLVRLDLRPEELPSVKAAVRRADAVEHVFTTVEGDVVFHARFRPEAVRTQLDDLVDLTRVREYDVTLLSDAEWTPNVGGAEFALSCAECGNTVTDEGESARIGGELYHFCCPSCRARFEETYERLEAGVE
jgi:DNA-binding Lrp family transcriptional regulator